jgi:uncharacterized protein involved in outer membrane biogenesis
MAATRRRKLRIGLIVLAMVVLVAVAGVAIAAASFDPDRLKPRIAAAIHQATGRAVTLDGPVRLALSLRPTLQVDQVKLGNAPGFAPAVMATVDRIDLTIALLPLLHRHIEIDSLDLIHPSIALRIDASGRENWRFEPPPSPPRPGGQSAPAGAPSRPTTLRIETIHMTDGALRFADARTGAAFAVDGLRLTATQGAAGGPIHLDATATDKSVPLSLSGAIGRPADNFMPVDLTVCAAGASVGLKGTVPALAVSASIPDLPALSPLIGRPLPGLHGLTLQTTLAPLPGGPISKGVVLTGLAVTSPYGTMSGDLSVAVTGAGMLSGTLTTKGFDPAALQAAWQPPATTTMQAPAATPVPPTSAPSSPAPSSPAPSSPAASSPKPAPATATPSWVISDRPLPVMTIPPVDADLTLIFQDSRIGPATFARATVHAVLKAGHLVLDPIVIDTPGGRADVTATADSSGAAALTLRAPNLAIQPLLAAFDQPDGTTAHALAADLSGSAGIALANGEIDNRLLVAMLSRIAPEAGFLDLAGKPGRSALRCVALRADVVNGVATLPALLVDTVPVRLTGSGSVDLAHETLALHLLPLARIGGTGLSVPVTISGTFRSPRAAVETKGGGRDSALAGIVIGALDADRLIAGAGQNDSCASQLKLARFDPPGPLPAALPATAGGKPKPPNLNDLLKQLLR